MIHHSCLVKLPQHSYPVYIGTDLLANEQTLLSHIHGKQVLIVTQENIACHYLPALQNQLSQFQCDIFFLPNGEQYKNIHEWQKIFDLLLQKNHGRQTTLIALGGGMVGDMTGFAAACYLRGVHYIQIPTTLIAQVDSAIGGKTGVNHELGKNMLGSFHHPQCVIADVNMLMTLSQREFVAGLAEVVKYGLIRDAEFFHWLEINYELILRRDLQALLHIVSRCITIKADIVMQDEKDNALRNLLNFGHTFGHALEAAMSYQDILHGEAVAFGMVMAARLSAVLGFISEIDVSRIVQLLKKFQLLQNFSEPPLVSELIELIKRDKKVENTKLQFILLKKIGKGVKISSVAEDQIIDVILQVCSREETLGY